MVGDTMYAWQVLEGGEWGVIAAMVVPEMGFTVLVARNLQMAQELGLYAVKHHDETGLPIRCVRWDDPVVIHETLR